MTTKSLGFDTPNLHQNLPNDRYYYLTEKGWEEILAYKKSFLENDFNPHDTKYLNKEVVASWLRSRELGINPYMEVNKPHLSLRQYKETMEKNNLIIDVTRPLVDTFKDMTILTSGYILYLCDENGAFLLQEGDMMRVPTEGLVWNENTIGTNVHSMCVRLKRPVQLMGPEHYCVALQNIIASAAPILDESGRVIATLILSQSLIERPWLESFQNLRSHTLGLITSLAAAVEVQIKLHINNEKLKESNLNLSIVNEKLVTTHSTLETTLAFIDEGIISIDRTGTIVHINKEGIRMLKLKSDIKEKINIKKFLCTQSRIMDLVLEGKNIDVEEALCVADDEQTYLVNIRPIVNLITNQVIAAVLKLTHIEKINALAVNRSGSIASYSFEDILGENKEFKKSIALAQRFANSSENILMIGESGTGKELFAQAIHNTYRPQGTFMAVNCAAMPRELIESELFGYEGGSFTGAERSGRPGKIELAHGGTLFLDEIGDMPIEIQAVLLRTLEDKQVMRIGGRRYKKVDFRLIAATNKDLYRMVEEHQYREDLYFRLSVLTLNIPPLRKRGNDIEVLSKMFVNNYCKKSGRKIQQISPAAQKKINEYRWPGNVRQLQNAMIYAVNTTHDDLIKPENLPNYILQDSGPFKINEVSNNNVLRLENLEKVAIEKALLHSNNYIPDAAEILGISRSTLYRKLKDYNISN
ncbi:sigma-54 interaction domain-containing protein [Desulfosporosinus nitroreducens]|uniref:Sigma 54-interacting transcriptional regulator n=1 Tax=Desulfosporosinus nitroreducens TaxID=2018668 RepID=A0ABT8QX13_9FIRM|nr:sigma 54-interacting transcriptional regulator [Desulfosporosinus nitroreducens]MDO0825883.1 sigma 54-interacting transcriptional regulator [Desulfosporosinus nitroreducens]